MSPPVGPVPRVALTIEDAAVAIGMSKRSFERHVMPDIRIIRIGRIRLIAITELERWANTTAEKVL